MEPLPVNGRGYMYRQTGGGFFFIQCLRVSPGSRPNKVNDYFIKCEEVKKLSKKGSTASLRKHTLYRMSFSTVNAERL
jgi:hypothetical protein